MVVEESTCGRCPGTRYSVVPVCNQSYIEMGVMKKNHFNFATIQASSTLNVLLLYVQMCPQ